jgi:chromate transporter
MMILIELYVQFFIIGITSFGGGYAVLPLINTMVVEGKGWLSVQEMTDLVSISNMTPGPIAINSATFVGTKMGGLSGSVAATMGVVTPSFILMLILAYLLFSSNRKLKFLEKMLKTLRPAIVGLIAIAAIKMTRSSIFVNDLSPESFSINIIPLICFVIGFVLYWKKVDITKLIGLGAALGIILNLIM